MSDKIHQHDMHTVDPAILFDRHNIMTCNQSALSLFGIQESTNTTPKDPFTLSPPTQPCTTNSPQLAAEYLKTTSTEGSTRFRWHFKRADGDREFLAEVQLNAMNIKGSPIYCCVLTNIAMPAANKGSQQASPAPSSLEHQLLVQCIKQFQERSASSGNHAALLHIGFDQFQQIRESQGKLVTDRLLIDITRRLKVVLRGSDEVVHLSDGQFAVLLDHLDGESGIAEKQVRMVVERMRSRLAEPYFLTHAAGDNSHTSEHSCTPSIGAALFCDSEVNAEELIQSARGAMEQVRANGGNALGFHHAD